MANTNTATATYTDTRCEAIERNLGVSIAEWADRNAAGWVLDVLADPDTAHAAAVAHVPTVVAR